MPESYFNHQNPVQSGSQDPTHVVPALAHLAFSQEMPATPFKYNHSSGI